MNVSLTMTAASLGERLSAIVELWERSNPGRVGDFEWERRRAGVAFAWYGVRQYRAYVDFALEGRNRVGSEFLRSVEMHRRLLFDGEDVGKSHAELYDERTALIPRVHYEIKCVHLFAKITLDRIAVAIRETFGGHNAPPLSRHVHVWKEGVDRGLRGYATARDIPAPPEELIALARRLEAATYFRDKQITHVENIRHSHGTLYNPQTRDVDIGLGVHFPTERDLDRLEAGELDSPKISALVDELDEYIHAVIEWVLECFAEPSSN